MKTISALFIITFLSLISCVKDGGENQSVKPGPEILYCITNNVNVRKNPDLKAEAVAVLHEGEAVEILERSSHETEVKLAGNPYSPAEKYSAPWYKIKNKQGIEGWAHGAFLYKTYFRKPEKKTEGLPSTSGSSYEGKINYYSPYLYIVGCSPSGNIAYMYYPTENPACGSSYFNIVNPALKKKPLFFESFCGLNIDVWDIYKAKINRKLNELEISPAEFILKNGPVESGKSRYEFRIDLKRRKDPYSSDTPREYLPVTGYKLSVSGETGKKVIAEYNFNEDWQGNVLFAGWFRNPCTGKVVALVIRMQVGETFDFIETDIVIND